MKLHDLAPPPGAKKKRKRVGRGIAAGQGKTAGRGMKGQGARAGGGVRPYFEGGQLPFVRRMPLKRGFVNIFRVEYTPVNLERLAGFAQGEEVTPESLVQAGIIKSTREPVAILGRGQLQHPLTIKAHRFSKKARQKIENAGGTAEVLPL
jgi:large subunit ribosomal protein L15